MTAICGQVLGLVLAAAALAQIPSALQMIGCALILATAYIIASDRVKTDRIDERQLLNSDSRKV